MVTIEDAKDVSDVIIKTLDPISVIIFGSVAKSAKGADLDLLIVTDDRQELKGDANLLIHIALKKFYKKFAIDPFIIPISLLTEYSFKGSPFLRLILKEGRSLYMKNSVEEWFKQAKEELNMALCLLDGKYFQGSCYHSQQSIEKSIKAILLKKGWELEKTHSIKRLLAIGEEYNVKINISDDEVVFIDSIYKGRYPIEAGLLPLGEPSEINAQKALDIANSVFKDMMP